MKEQNISSYCSCNPESYPFWCERHQCMKTENWVKLCKNRPSYFEAWEYGCGPGQNHPPEFYENQRKSREKRERQELSRQRKINNKNKPGDELKGIIQDWIQKFDWFRFGIPYHECSCDSIFVYMNTLGPKGCTKNINKLVKRLRRVAEDHRFLANFDDSVAEKMIKQAIRRTKRRYPSTKVMMKGFVESMTNWSKTGFSTVSTNEYKKRIEICRNCDFFDEHGRCEICYCFMIAKCWLASEECPKQKWLQIDNDTTKEVAQ